MLGLFPFIYLGGTLLFPWDYFRGKGFLPKNFPKERGGLGNSFLEGKTSCFIAFAKSSPKVIVGLKGSQQFRLDGRPKLGNPFSGLELFLLWYSPHYFSFKASY